MKIIICILLLTFLSLGNSLDLQKKLVGTGYSVGTVQISNATINIFSGCNENNENDKINSYATSGQLQYNDLRTGSSLICLSYKIKANNQSHIGLFSTSQPKQNPWIEIVVGGTPNGLGNIFRKNGVDVGPTYNQLGNSLNNNEFRGFWVSWLNGLIKVGLIGKTEFMKWQDPQPFKITHVGVDTCCSTIGEVILDDEPHCPGVN